MLGRWFTRWLLRGGPWSVAAKLIGVALWGTWRWRRQQRRIERETRAREIESEYEVIDRARVGNGGSPDVARAGRDSELRPRGEGNQRG